MRTSKFNLSDGREVVRYHGSSNIYASVYNPATRDLTVTFLGGDAGEGTSETPQVSYIYKGVSAGAYDHFSNRRNEQSAGKSFWDAIRYPCRKSDGGETAKARGSRPPYKRL